MKCNSFAIDPLVAFERFGQIIAYLGGSNSDGTCLIQLQYPDCEK